MLGVDYFNDDVNLTLVKARYCSLFTGDNVAHVNEICNSSRINIRSGNRIVGEDEHRGILVVSVDEAVNGLADFISVVDVRLDGLDDVGVVAVVIHFFEIRLGVYDDDVHNLVAVVIPLLAEAVEALHYIPYITVMTEDNNVSLLKPVIFIKADVYIRHG